LFTSSKIAIARVCQIAAALALAWLAGGCADTAVYQQQVHCYGPERYSAWFADERDGVIYFGLSPFWTELQAHGGAATGDLDEPSAHLIGRFELGRGGFLPMLVARRPADDSRSSVWDVLAHPNGWVYYTTYFEEMGRVRPATGDVEHFTALGTGLNEIAVGPSGNLYVTRYGAADPKQRAAHDGALVELTPEGAIVREVPLHARDGAFTAPKSVAVDPSSGEVWLNADVIAPDGAVSFAAFHLGADLSVRETLAAPPELMFVAFDPKSRWGVFVEDDAGRVRARLVGGGGEFARVDLGPREAHDFAQDVHFGADGMTAVVAFWSGRVELLRWDSAKGARTTRVQLEKPAGCESPALFYSAFLEPDGIYATLYCDATIVRAPLP
jgi:hypothetical protein